MATISAAVALCAVPWSAWALDETAYGGSPVPIGAGARALGMGGAFAAIADDASAATWNPGGMTQLDRLEAGVTGGFYAIRTSGSDGTFANHNDAALDSASLVLPFFAYGCQQTIGLAWQREYDFTRSFNEHDSSVTAGFPFTVTNASVNQIVQSGSFASDSLSYAIELTPGFSLGLTGKAWADRVTGDSAYHQDQVTTEVTTLTGFGPPTPFADVVAGRRTERVTSGYSGEIGAWWQASSNLSLGLVYAPRYTLRMSIDSAYLDETTQTPTSSDDVGHLTFPTRVTVGTAWRHDDALTVACDATWTHWREYQVNDAGMISSPVAPTLSPAEAHDGLSLRLGIEQLLIGEQWTAVVRGGVFYEGLPGATRVDTPEDAYQARATTDNYIGATAGLSISLRSIIWDLGAQVRYGHHVGAGQFAGPDQSVDLTTVIIRSGLAYQY
jgi:long-subunit fatty acid transport protein